MNMGFGINTKHREGALTTPFKCIDTNSCGPCGELDEGTSWWKQPFFHNFYFLQWSVQSLKSLYNLPHGPTDKVEDQGEKK